MRDADKITPTNIREYLETLDLAYRAVDALGGTGASEAYNAALDEAINAIANLGGMDAYERRTKGFPTFAKLTKSADDGGQYFRLWNLPVGHVVTHQNAADLQHLLNEHNDMIGEQADVFHEGRLHALREIGGEELVQAVITKNSERVSAIGQRAMDEFRAKRGALS